MRAAAATPYELPRNAVIAASAGTGKTHCLVGAMVHLLLGACREGAGLRAPLEPSRLVATTFSRRAAAEIRARLVEALEALAEGDPAAVYRRDLAAACERVGLSPWTDKELRARATRALAGVGRAQIGTMHSIATSLARAHALELGLASGFELVDEDRYRERVTAAVVRVIDGRAAHDPTPLRALARATSGVDRLVEQMVALLERLTEDGGDASDLAVAADEDVGEIEARLEELLAHARALSGDAALGGPARALLEAQARSDADALMEAAAALCAVAARGARSAPAEAFFAFRTELPGSTHAVKGKQLVRAWRARHLVGPQVRAARDLVAACELEVRRQATRDGVLGFGDVLRLVRDLLQNRPDVAAEVSADLEALLVDELQDTSRVQRDLVLLLWDRDPRHRPAGRGPSLAELRQRGLFLVGDRKQSIYGFRGADVGLFAEMAVGLAGAPAREALGIAPGRLWEPETPCADFFALRHNRRAEPELLTFANAYSRLCFRSGSDVPAAFEIEYVGATEDLIPPESVEPARAETPRATWLRLSTGGAVTSSLSEEARVIAEHVLRIVESGEPKVRGGARPSFRDVAVLAQRHAALDAAADAFARAGIPYVVEGRGFYSAREVCDLASLLALVLDPEDRLALLEVLRGPWAAVRDETLMALTDAGRGLASVGPAWDVGERRGLVCEDDREALAEVRRVVTALHTVADRLGPGDLLREAVDALELEQVLAALPRGSQRIANVRKLLALADRQTDARVFLAQLHRAAEEEVAETEAATFSEEDDAVRLLTVHASKGLDFPIVFLPEVGHLARPAPGGAITMTRAAVGRAATLAARVVDEDGVSFDPPSFAAAVRLEARRDAAERARLSYVAATRACSAMVFVGDRRPPSDGGGAAFARTTAGLLHELARDEPTRRAAALQSFDVTPAPRQPARTEPLPSGAPAPEPLVSPTFETIDVGLDALELFSQCPRRFELACELEVPDPSVLAATDPTPSVRRVELGGRRSLRIHGAPTKLAMVDDAAVRARLASLGERLVQARWKHEFPRVAPSQCRALGCGYLALCHPPGHEGRQLSFSYD